MQERKPTAFGYGMKAIFR